MAHDRFALKREPGGVNRDILLEDFGKSHHTMVNHAVQDCTPVIDANSRLRGHRQYGTPKLGAKMVARVPDIFWYMIWPLQFKEKYGASHTANRHMRRLWKEFVMTKLNDRDYQKFRVDEGRLAMPQVFI